jgi:hypothetical protein
MMFLDGDITFKVELIAELVNDALLISSPNNLFFFEERN